MSRAFAFALAVAALLALSSAAHADERIDQLCAEMAQGQPHPDVDAAVCTEMLGAM